MFGMGGAMRGPYKLGQVVPTMRTQNIDAAKSVGKALFGVGKKFRVANRMAYRRPMTLASKALNVAKVIGTSLE